MARLACAEAAVGSYARFSDMVLQEKVAAASLLALTFSLTLAYKRPTVLRQARFLSGGAGV